MSRTSRYARGRRPGYHRPAAPIRSHPTWVIYRTQVPFAGSGLRFFVELLAAADLPPNRESWRRLRRQRRRAESSATTT